MLKATTTYLSETLNPLQAVFAGHLENIPFDLTF